jgi:hypothetical protein
LSVFPFEIKDYTEEGEVSCFASKTSLEEPALSAEIRDQLQLMLPYLEKDSRSSLRCEASLGNLSSYQGRAESGSSRYFVTHHLY